MHCQDWLARRQGVDGLVVVHPDDPPPSAGCTVILEENGLLAPARIPPYSAYTPASSCGPAASTHAGCRDLICSSRQRGLVPLIPFNTKQDPGSIQSGLGPIPQAVSKSSAGRRGRLSPIQLPSSAREAPASAPSRRSAYPWSASDAELPGRLRGLTAETPQAATDQ